MSDFSLDKKTTVFIAVCCLAVGGLLFFAGILVGLDRGSHETQARMEKEFSARLAAAKPPEAAQPQSEDSEIMLSESSDSDPAEPPDSPSQPRLLPVSAGSPASVAERTSSAAKVPEENSASDAAEDSASDEESADSEPASDFSLQIGAFRSQDNAARLRDDLKARGYAAFLLRTVDDRGNEWHTVRLGHYRDRAEAFGEAASFSSETQKAAVVRPANQ
jgi:cell division septation protein DedD